MAKHKSNEASSKDKSGDGEGIMKQLEFILVPPVMMVFFSLLCLGLPYWGRNDTGTRTYSLFGNPFAWTCVAAVLSWCALSIKLTKTKFRGPTTSHGFTPVYSGKGMQFFTVSILMSISVERIGLAPAIYDNMPEIIAALSNVAFALCTYLYVKGKYFPECGEPMEPKPVLYEFFRGMELHATILGGVDVKQFICRFCMLVWGTLGLMFLSARLQMDNGELNPGFTVNVAIQFLYSLKFFWWETGFVDTFDMIYERAGYYWVYGSLVFVPIFYPYTSYWFVNNPPVVPSTSAWIIFVIALIAILIEYRIDYEKQVVRAHNGDWSLYGKPVKVINAKYLDAKGKERTSKLLVSGFWGLARHMNYTCELMISLCICAPGLGLGSIIPFLYCIFVFPLLIHRIHLDDKKCRTKYGKYWKEYCQRVPYRLIPYVY